MRCPRCKTRFELPEDLADTGCPSCLWVPVDTARELLMALDQAGTAEWKHSLGYLGQGIVLALGQLGFLSAEDSRRWTQRLLDAAGIEWRNIQFSSSVQVHLEVEKEDRGSHEPDETDPS